MAITYCTCTSAELSTDDDAVSTLWSGCRSPHVEFAGAVLGTFERNSYDDSDFYAVVWDGEKVRSVEYASTRGWTYHNSAHVDATDDVKAAALAWYRERWTDAAIATAHANAQAPNVKGRRVRSLTKRGKNVGVTGEVRWLGPIQIRYGLPQYEEQRIGVQVDGECSYRFLPRKSLETVEPATIDEDAIRELGYTVRPPNWHSALYVDYGRALVGVK